MSSKPGTTARVVVVAIGLAISIAIGVWFYGIKHEYNSGFALSLVIIPISLSIIIQGIISTKSKPDMGEWYWENKKHEIVDAIGPTDAPPDKEVYYQVKYRYDNETYSVCIARNDPDFHWIEKHLHEKPQPKPKPVIVKASIIAVNSVGVKNNISITKAVLGGIIAGGPGAILGGMSGTQTPGHNVFTFVVTYDNGEKHVEKVDEGTKRFHKLVEYLDD